MIIERNEVPTIKTTIKSGERWNVKGKVTDTKTESEDAIDLTGYTALMQFRSTCTKELLVELNHENGIILKDDSDENNYEIDLASNNSLLLNDFDDVSADFFIFKDDVAYPIFNLELSVERSHTIWIPQSPELIPD